MNTVKIEEQAKAISIQLVLGRDQGSTEVCVVVQTEAKREGGAYNAGPDFVSFVSLATSLAHVDGVRFAIATGVREGLGDGREGELAGP